MSIFYSKISIAVSTRIAISDHIKGQNQEFSLKLLKKFSELVINNLFGQKSHSSKPGFFVDILNVNKYNAHKTMAHNKSVGIDDERKKTLMDYY